MTDFLHDWALAFWAILVESGPWLLLGLAVAGLVKEWLSPERVARRLGRDDLGSVTLASVVGAPLPLCSCSVIPTAVALRRAGASRGATTGFLIATPETGVDSVSVTWALMDPVMTVLRPVAAVGSAVATGLAVGRFGGPGPDAGDDGASGADGAAAGGACCAAAPDAQEDSPATEDASGGAAVACHATEAEAATPCASAGPRTSFPRRVLRGLAYGYGSLLADVTGWFLLGFTLSALVTVLLPDDFFGSVFPSGFAAMLLMLVAGLPIYICASASTPLAAAFLAKGLSPGATLVFLLAGPATNFSTLITVRGLFGTRSAALYVGGLAVCSLAFGFLADAVYPWLGLTPTTHVAADALHEHHGTFAILAGAVLGLLLLFHATRLWVLPRFRREPGGGGSCHAD